MKLVSSAGLFITAHLIRHSRFHAMVFYQEDIGPPHTTQWRMAVSGFLLQRLQPHTFVLNFISHYQNRNPLPTLFKLIFHFVMVHVRLLNYCTGLSAHLCYCSKDRPEELPHPTTALWARPLLGLWDHRWESVYWKWATRCSRLSASWVVTASQMMCLGVPPSVSLPLLLYSRSQDDVQLWGWGQ